MNGLNIIENLNTTSTMASSLVNMVGVVLVACITLLAFLGIFLSLEQSKQEESLKSILLKLVNSFDGIIQGSNEAMLENSRYLRLEYWNYCGQYSVLQKAMQYGVRLDVISIGKYAVRLAYLLLAIGWGLLEMDLETSTSTDFLLVWLYRLLALAVSGIMAVLLYKINQLFLKIDQENVLTQYPSPDELLDLRPKAKFIDTIDFMTNSVLCYIKYDDEYKVAGKELEGLLVKIALPLPFYSGEIAVEVYIEKLDRTIVSPRVKLRSNSGGAANPKNIPIENYSFFFEISKLITKHDNLGISLNVYPEQASLDDKIQLMCYPYNLSKENSLKKLRKGQNLDLQRSFWLTKQDLAAWQKCQDELIVVADELVEK